LRDTEFVRCFQQTFVAFDRVDRPEHSKSQPLQQKSCHYGLEGRSYAGQL
jgi:hypothetical protein